MDKSKAPEVKSRMTVDLKPFIGGCASAPAKMIPVEERMGILEMFLKNIEPHTNSIGMSSIEQRNLNVRLAINTPGFGISSCNADFTNRVIEPFKLQVFCEGRHLDGLLPDHIIVNKGKWAFTSHTLYLREDLRFVFAFACIGLHRAEAIHLKVLTEEELHLVISCDEYWVEILKGLDGHMTSSLRKKEMNLGALRTNCDQIHAMAVRMALY